MTPDRHEDTHSKPAQSEPQGTGLAQLSALEAVRAPDSLHRTIERMVGDAAAQPHRRRLSLPQPPWSWSGSARPLRLRLAGAAAVLAAAAAVLVLVLGSGGPSTPTVLEASRVALAPATLASPSENPRDRTKLDASVEGLAYPYWGRGWPAAGERHDRLGNRSVTTVFYASLRGARIGYAIVAGRALAEPSAGTVLLRGGVRFRVLDANGATIVTWREAGHTCILAARGVPATAMVRLVLS